MEFDRNPTLDALCARKSVRVFTEEPVPQAVKNALFQAAMQAPTAGNQMLYTILDITDDALKARLADLCDHQPFISDAPVVLVFVVIMMLIVTLLDLAFGTGVGWVFGGTGPTDS